MDFVVVAPRNNSAVLAKLESSRVLGRAGEFFVAIPQAALDPIRQKLAGRHRQGCGGAGSAVEQTDRDTRSIRAEVVVHAVIEEDGFTLGDIAGLRVGNVLQLQATPKSRIKLECKIGRCSGVRSARRRAIYTLSVDEIHRYASRNSSMTLLQSLKPCRPGRQARG